MRLWLGVLGPVISAIAAVAIVWLTHVNNKRSLQFQDWTVSQREPEPIFIRGEARTTENESSIGGVAQLTLFNPGDVPIFLLRGSAVVGWTLGSMAMHPAGAGLHVLKSPEGGHELYHSIPMLEGKDVMLDISFPKRIIDCTSKETRLSLVLDYISGKKVKRAVYPVLWIRSDGVLHFQEASNVGANQG